MAAEELDYKTEIKKLENSGPGRLYLLYGEEDYLLSLYYEELKNAVIPEGDNGFNYKRIDSSEPDLQDVINALDIMPFMSERTFVEFRGMDINKYKESDGLISTFENIPDYCTVVIIPEKSFAPDMRLKLNKRLKDIGTVINFTVQSGKRLINWIIRRFKAESKTISEELAERLVFVSGDSMSGLIPEIDKISAYSKGMEITLEDINEVAHHLPESDIFEMIDNLIQGNVKTASSMLSELLFSKETGEPVYLIAMIGMQLKKILAAKLASNNNKGSSFLVASGIFKYDRLANKAIQTCRKISLSKLAEMVDLCAEADFRMKQGQIDSLDILMETFTLIAKGIS